MADAALREFGVGVARVTLLRHEHNTTFRVDAAGGRYVLRVNRARGHDMDVVASETAWLRALRDDTGLGVPEPVAATDGSFVVEASASSVPESRLCVLLRWQTGRFVDGGLRPTHMAAVGVLLGGLQQHAAGWTPPAGFVRPHVDAISGAARRASVSGHWQADDGARHPAPSDTADALELVERLLSPGDAALVGGALESVHATSRELSADVATTGLIHGDLHYENVLFRSGEALAIDFDDCGWGFYLYDVAVSLTELDDRPRYPSLRDALLDAYAARRPLPPRFEAHLQAFAALRRVQLLLWILESRELPAFRDEWRVWAEDELDALRRALG